MTIRITVGCNEFGKLEETIVYINNKCYRNVSLSSELRLRKLLNQMVTERKLKIPKHSTNGLNGISSVTYQSLQPKMIK